MPLVTSRRGGSNGTGVPPPRVTNSCTAVSPSSAGNASSCTIRLSCHAGRSSGFSHVPPDPVDDDRRQHEQHQPGERDTCRTRASGEMFVAIVQRASSCAGHEPDGEPDDFADQPVGSETAGPVRRQASARDRRPSAIATTAPSGSDGKASAGTAPHSHAHARYRSTGMPSSRPPRASNCHQPKCVAARWSASTTGRFQQRREQARRRGARRSAGATPRRRTGQHRRRRRATRRGRADSGSMELHGVATASIRYPAASRAAYRSIGPKYHAGSRPRS